MRRKRERGNALIEFGFGLLLLIPLFLGSVAGGLSLGRSIQVTQICRDTGHMFLDGVDFTDPQKQLAVGRLAYGMGMTTFVPASGNTPASAPIDPNGNGLVILSQVLMVGANACGAAGYATTGQCPNFNQLVLIKRVYIGNQRLRPSSYGTPSAALLQVQGDILPQDYASNASVVVPAGTSIVNLNLPLDKFTYVSEAYFVSPELAGFKTFFGGAGSALDASYASNFF